MAMVRPNGVGKAVLSGLPVVFFEPAPPSVSARIDFSFPPVDVQVIPGSVYTNIFADIFESIYLLAGIDLYGLARAA